MEYSQTQLAQGARTQAQMLNGLESIPSVLANRGLGLVLFILCSPLLLVLAVLVLCFDGRPILYKGARLGSGQRTFFIYKFRTLRVDANKLMGSSLHKEGSNMASTFGQWLRDSRLDELPQLLNIVLGDMNFIGPRPERQEVYEDVCQYISNYDKRFNVKPGLIGFAQVFTPHGTPKRIRTMLDNRMYARKRTLRADIQMIAFTAMRVIQNTLVNTWRILKLQVWQVRIRGQHEVVDRKHTRYVTQGTSVFFSIQGQSHIMPMLDISDHAFRIRGNSNLRFEPGHEMTLRVTLTEGRTMRHAQCRGTVIQTRDANGLMDYVVHYVATTENSHYLIQQYLLRKSVATPNRRRHQGAT
ncbi:MAG: lipopolysaccharide/colanic/teichoic acid biosynthesis glycosyltransferase [Kiritimatiellia bacterium]|jgi:lipopolysaccharide/colanic/teichoic acid biosynthesis glycosyltransferase